jgi:replicative DNA helicase
MTDEHDDGPHPLDPANDAKALPASMDAEQALLGSILYDNAAMERIPEKLRPDHFHEPFHARMYEAVLEFVHKGRLIEPIVFMERFRHDQAFAELGGLHYFADLVDRAPPSANAPEYAETIYDLAMRRDLIRLGEQLATVARTDRRTPAPEIVELTERELFAIASQKHQKGLTSFASVLERSLEMAAQAYARDGEMAGLATGLMDLDKKLGGLRPSDLIVLAGRPSMGKTALATNIAFHVARTYEFEEDAEGRRKTARGGVVAFFSLEMSEEQLGLRILADASGVQGDRIMKGDIDATEFARIVDAAREIQGAPLYIDDTGAISIAALTTRCRRMKRTTGLDLVVVDYLQLVMGTRPGMETPARIAEVTQGLKAMAKDLDIPVIALSQVSRKVEEREDKRPQLSDLRESGSIEQDADAVLFVFREHYYLSRSEPKEGTPKHMEWEEACEACRNVAEVIIGKQRHGPIGTVKLAFSGDTTKFSNHARGA